MDPSGQLCNHTRELLEALSRVNPPRVLSPRQFVGEQERLNCQCSRHEFVPSLKRALFCLLLNRFERPPAAFGEVACALSLILVKISQISS